MKAILKQLPIQTEEDIEFIEEKDWAKAMKKLKLPADKWEAYVRISSIILASGKKGFLLEKIKVFLQNYRPVLQHVSRVDRTLADALNRYNGSIDAISNYTTTRHEIIAREAREATEVSERRARERNREQLLSDLPF